MGCCAKSLKGGPRQPVLLVGSGRATHNLSTGDIGLGSSYLLMVVAGESIVVHDFEPPRPADPGFWYDNKAAVVIGVHLA